MLKWALVAAGGLAGLVGIAAGVGSLLPQGHVARRERTFTRAAADVFATIANVERYPDWRPDVRDVRLVRRDPVRWIEDGRHGAIAYEVEESAAPRRFVVRIADRDLPFGGRWIYELQEERAGTTRLSITEEGEVYNPIFRLLSRFVFSHTATIETYLEHLGRRLERP